MTIGSPGKDLRLPMISSGDASFNQETLQHMLHCGMEKLLHINIE